MRPPEAGQWYRRPDGAELRIDYVKNGRVYFVSWLPGQEFGSPVSLTRALFADAVSEQRMIPARSSVAKRI